VTGSPVTADAAPAHAAPASPARKARAARWRRGLTGVIAFLVIAELLGVTGIIPTSVLPLMSTVLGHVFTLLGSGRFLADLAATVEAWAVGLAVTVIIGVPVGVLLGSVPGVRVATRAVVEFLRPIPSVALILLVSLWLGPGLRTSVTLIVYGAIWPVLYNTMAGLDDVDPVARETSRAFGFSALDTIRMVSLPSAAPFIATGVRLASSVAIILDIGTGYITGRINGPGLGAFIADYSSGAGNLPVILAATVWAGILGLVLDRAIVGAEHRLLRWNYLRLAGSGANS
jgi:NitT/TauT family transport system permease protein